MKTVIILGLVLVSEIAGACALEKRSGSASSGSTTASTATSGPSTGSTLARNIGGSSSAFSRETTGDPFGSVGTREGRAAEGESLRKPGSSRRGTVQ